jgi:hypothetical protein
MTEPTELSEAVAEITAQAVGQQLFGELFERLSDGAEDLLVRASVFRTPVAPGVLAAAHRQAAGYWHARTATPELGPRAHLEVAHHLRQAGDLAAQAATAAPMIASGSGQVTSTPARDHESGPHTRRRLHRIGLVSVAGFTAAFLAVEAPTASPPPT